MKGSPSLTNNAMYVLSNTDSSPNGSTWSTNPATMSFDGKKNNFTFTNILTFHGGSLYDSTNSFYMESTWATGGWAQINSSQFGYSYHNETGHFAASFVLHDLDLSSGPNSGAIAGYKGIAPIGATPELSTSLMLTIGVLGLGFMGWRRKDSAAFLG